jgi:hypothetical protein
MSGCVIEDNIPIYWHEGPAVTQAGDLWLRPNKRKRPRIGGRFWPVRGLKSGQSPTGTSEL